MLLAPLRAEAERWALARWPWLDATRRALLSNLAARVRREVMSEYAEGANAHECEHA